MVWKLKPLQKQKSHESKGSIPDYKRKSGSQEMKEKNLEEIISSNEQKDKAKKLFKEKEARKK